MCQGPIHSQSNRITMQFRLLSICNKSDFQCSMTLNVSRSDLFPSTVIHHYIFSWEGLRKSSLCVYVPLSQCPSSQKLTYLFRMLFALVVKYMLIVQSYGIYNNLFIQQCHILWVGGVTQQSKHLQFKQVFSSSDLKNPCRPQMAVVAP